VATDQPQQASEADEFTSAAPLVESVIKFAQINLARSSDATSSLDKIIRKEKLDVVLVQEPSTDGRGISLLDKRPYLVIASDGNPRAAIVIADINIGVLALRHLCSTHAAVAVLTKGSQSLTVVSSYFQFKEATEIDIEKIQRILDSTNGDVLIGSDINARSTCWHDESTDSRGKLVEEFVATNGLNVENISGQPRTFNSHYRGSANLDPERPRATMR
jgi:hypothetical protein